MRSRKKVSTVPTTPWRASLHNLIFEAETKAGKTFDIILMILIVLSVATVMLDSVAAVRSEYGELLHNLEWFFTIVFAIEYVLRLVATLRPWRYALSFFWPYGSSCNSSRLDKYFIPRFPIPACHSSLQNHSNFAYFRVFGLPARMDNVVEGPSS